jgi:O-antigen ligase
VKWIIFALGLAAILPLAGWLRSNPRELPRVWMIIGALPFLMSAFPKYEIAILGEPEWPGILKGFDISAMDLIIWAVYLGRPRARPVLSIRLPFKFSFVLYIGAVLLSALQAPNPTATFYYAWQLLRIFIVYAVVARACLDNRLTISLLKGLAFGLCFEACFVLWQRFILHYLHVAGTFGQQNMVGFATHFVVIPFFALLLSRQIDWRLAAIPIIGAIINVITTSRASIGFLGGGLSVLFLLSMLRKWTGRKVRILAASVFVLALLSPLAYRQLELRYGPSGLPAYEEQGGREQLNDTAQMILADNPWGIGANNFYVVANRQGYYQRAGVAVLSDNLIPHNIYWTTAAEIGYVGLVAFMIFLIRPLLLALSCGWRNRKDQRGDLLLGLAISLITVYLHSYFEWALLSDMAQYLFAINIGMVAGLAQQLGHRSDAAQVFVPSRPKPSRHLST